VYNNLTVNITTQASIETILEGYKARQCSFDETVVLLEALFQSQPAQGQAAFVSQMEFRLRSDSYSYLREERSVQEPLIRAWAQFGPTDRLPKLIFALLRNDDDEKIESWTRKIAPEFVHSLWTNRTRFSRAALDDIKGHCAPFIFTKSAGIVSPQYPASLLEAASRIDQAVDKINFDRFAATLQQARPQSVPAGSDVPPIDLKLEILRTIAGSGSRAVNKYNLLGKPGVKGELEFALARPLGTAERVLAYGAFRELEKAGLIVPTYSDLVNPEDWVVITDAGQRALKTGVFDRLDEILLSISPHLPNLRRGAWAVLNSGGPHSREQAAHSARELVDQVLKIGAPDEEVKAQTWYHPDSSTSSGITRRMRLRLLADRFASERSDTDLRVSEKACEFLIAVDAKLMALAHARIEPDPEEVRSAIQSAEIALKSVLISFRRSE
jgi:hypothetical protein